MPLSTASRMLTCRWAARRLHRYLDADPSMPLPEVEVLRLEDHLSKCEKCSGLTEDFRGLGRLLRLLRATSEPDPKAVARLHAHLSALTSGDDK